VAQRRSQRKKYRLSYKGVKNFAVLPIALCMMIGLAVFINVNNNKEAEIKDSVIATGLNDGPAFAEASATGAEPEARPTPSPEQPESNMLPILSTVKTNENMIAITIDDCFQSDNVVEIVRICEAYGAKVTFFPVGRGINNAPGVWKWMHDLGYQIENHTYTHTDLLKLDEADIREEIIKLSNVINRELGVNYRMRFLRTLGGNARSDERVHKIMRELGYEFMAHWAQTGTGSANTPEAIVNAFKPGRIVLFHTTNTDLQKLREVIPLAVSRGYRLVTLNELLGLGPNEVTPLDD
jgi:peptidoglycan/xylan/chitin deacetylase (PgdA/CDA1 family)